MHRFVHCPTGSFASPAAGPKAWFLAALMLIHGAGIWAAEPPPTVESPKPAELLLTNIHQVASLNAQAVSTNHYKALVRGVIIYVSPPTRRLYVQDGGVGIQVNLTGSVSSFRQGQEVEIEGEVGDDLPHPRLLKARARVLGTAPMPKPGLVSARRLNSGKDIYRWITVRGVVRDMISDPNSLTLLMADQHLTYELVVPVGDFPLPRDWIDAELEASGFAFPIYNARRQPVGFRFHVPTMDFVRMTKPGTGTLFDRPTMTIAEAARQPMEWQPRLKIVGTVTANQPADVLFVDDGTGQMQVNFLSLLRRPANGQSLEHEAPSWFQPGDRVEVIGVRRNWSSLTPTLIQAEVRRIGHVDPLRPRPVTIEDLEAGRFSGQLVSIEARLLDQRLWVPRDGLLHQLLVLQANEHIFQATWENDTSANWDLQPGSFVRLTGVNDAIQGRFKGACIFNVLLRSPEDVVSLPDPPFWKRREFRRGSLAASGAAVLVLGWLFLQRAQMRRLERRVADRTVDLRHANTRLQEEVMARQRAETEVQRALIQEKELSELKSRFVSMVSHEFRTPLGIIASSAEILEAYLDRLSVQERRENLRDITEATRHMSRMMEAVLLLGRVEAGKMTCQPVPIDLGLFSAKIADEITSATGGRCPITLNLASGLDLTRADETLLRHILTNLLSNAVKYSVAGSDVELSIERVNQEVRFAIRDRGIGIPEADQRQMFQAFHRGTNVGNVPGTGLGMTIVKRCVDLHGGAISFESKVGEGTTFWVTLPLFESSRDGHAVGDTDGDNGQPNSSPLTLETRDPALNVIS